MNIMHKTNLIRILTLLSFLVMLALPLSAQEKEDSVFTFRFLSGKDMFFAPGMNNGFELSRLFDSVARYKDLINDREITLHVDGYYNIKGKKGDRYKIARIRSNRVKSELITRKKLKEYNFITKNHPAEDNYVTVRFMNSKGEIVSIPMVIDKQPEPTPEPQPEVQSPTEQGKGEQDIDLSPDNDIAEDTSAPSDQNIPDESADVDTLDVSGILPRIKHDSRFALKTNLLGYAVLMPNIEIEWKFADRWSVALEGQRAWYAKKSPHKVYRLATIIPEVRFWIIERSRWHGMYVGIFGGGGMYDLSNGKKKGHEGEGGMVGVSAGYMWPISKHLSLDAGIGLGYMRVRDKEYMPLDGHFLYQLTKNINYFGPLRLKLSLVWRIPK